MKLINALFASLICVPALAQRDYSLVEQRNFWLTSGNAASLTTFADSTIAEGTVAYQYDGGRLRSLSEGRHQNTYGAEVGSYARLNRDVVVYGRIAYRNTQGSAMSGSMLLPTSDLMPFDLVDDSLGNAGSKRTEMFDLTGAVGWRVWKGLSVGAKVDYTAGNYAKHRDLRHTNTLMNLMARANVFYSFGEGDGIGAGFLYRRRTETVQFKSYGTTDKVFKTLIDYANHYGTVETFGSEGFTDGTQEQPLVSQYVGLTAQGGYHGFFMDFSYLHRTGYYGKESQYTVSNAKHHGDCFSWDFRYQLPTAPSFLSWIDLSVATERLTSERTNYRRVQSAENTSVLYYEYYEPTKMADKVQTTARLAYTAHWLPIGGGTSPDYYLWHLQVGADYWHTRQTAYLYPAALTAEHHTFSPYADVRRSVLFRDRSLLAIGLGYGMTFGALEKLDARLRVAYELPLLHGTIRPSIALDYNFSTGLGDTWRGLSRNTIAVSLGCTF